MVDDSFSVYRTLEKNKDYCSNGGVYCNGYIDDKDGRGKTCIFRGDIGGGGGGMINKNGLAPPEQKGCWIAMAAPKGIAWDALKKEYITGTISQEALAEKYGIGIRTVVDRARKEHWFDRRKDWRRKVAEKSIERAAEEAAKKDTRIYDICNSLIDKIAEAAVDIDPLNVQAFRALTIALKDIKDLRGDKDERDIAEQEARIAKLRADAKKAEEDRAGAAAVEIVGLPEDYKG